MLIWKIDWHRKFAITDSTSNDVWVGLKDIYKPINSLWNFFFDYRLLFFIDVDFLLTFNPSRMAGYCGFP